MMATTPSRRRIVETLAATALLAGCGGPSARGPYGAAQDLMNRSVACRRVAGVTAAVSLHGAPVEYLNAGAVALGAQPADPDSIYRIYSMTKPIVGVATMQLIERGLLTLDQPLADIAPEFASMRVLANPNTMETRPASRQITIRHLLTHTSGFTYHINGEAGLEALYRQRGITPVDRTFDPPAPGELPLPATLEEFAARLAELPLAFEPGAEFRYSVSFDLLGLVIQRASGVPFSDYLRDNVFAPLGMHDTSFVVPTEKLPRLTTNYRLVRGSGLTVFDDRADSAYASLDAMPSGGAGLVSTTRDYARFAQLLRDGEIDGARVLSEETARLACSNLLPPGVSFSSDQGFAAGMSLRLTTWRDEPVGAFGWRGRAGAIFWIDPARRAYAVMMTQCISAPPEVADEFRAALSRDIERAR